MRIPTFRALMPSGLVFPLVPASFFGIVLGISGLGRCWQVAALQWNMPPVIGDTISLIAVAVWLIVTLLYAAKWLVAPSEALEEAHHPIQCCFIGLAGVATMLAGLAFLPYSHFLAAMLVLAGATFSFLFLLWRTGRLWRDNREATATTPVLYLPSVAASFVAAIAAGTFGYGDWGQMAFGAGFFSWLAIESVILNRLFSAPEMIEALRPTLGIQLAPPAVGSVAYLSLTNGPPDMVVRAMLGYGLVQALLLLRLLPWITKQQFAASYWAFSFGATAMSTAMLRAVARGESGAIAALAPVIFIGTNLIIAMLVLGSLRLLLRGEFLPKASLADLTTRARLRRPL